MKLLKGDCLDRMKEIPDGSVDMILTDPPYGTTACKWDTVIDLQLMWEQLKRITKPNGAIVMTASQPFTTKLISSNYKMFKYCWVWEKQKVTGFYNARRMPLKSVEDVCVFGYGSLLYNPQGTVSCNVKNNRKNKGGNGVYGRTNNNDYVQKEGNFPRSVLRFNHITHGQVHPTQKPVALMEYLIKTYTNETETVLDFTMGSGTTGVACIRNNRKFIGIEMDKVYFDNAHIRLLNESLFGCINGS
jgi:site-specific DNA-methyltransferase (adenine-specific)